MKFPLLLNLVLGCPLSLIAQNKDTNRIAQTLSEEQILAPLKYLSSDHLNGRYIGLPEIDSASTYIAGQFRKAGDKPVPGASEYYQIFIHQFTHQEIHLIYQYISQSTPFLIGDSIKLKNILAFVPGTDPQLRNQYILLSSHYDHIGKRDSAIMVNGKMDSIFNGARDNATGTAAVIAAARYFARYPPKRSVLFICYSAEEEGEIGSNYYADYPLIPLEHTVYNLNVDNAGYDTTHAVCLFGLGRTSADSLVQRACMAYGLALLPEPGYDLFKRSDNYPLAQKGIPAPTFSLGMTNWDKEITAHYHQLSDEVDNMDLSYTVKFIRAYILSAEYIANSPLQPKWTVGDEYEKNWEALFRKKYLHHLVQ